MQITINLNQLLWSSNLNGYEVGYPELDVVGLYIFQKDVGPTINFYIDMESCRVLDMWSECDCF